MHDWRKAVRERLSSAQLHPQDEAEIVEEVGQHLDDQFADLSPRIGAAAAKAQLMAQLREQTFDDAAAGRRRRARPTQSRTWSSTSALRDIRYGVRSLRRSPLTVVAGVAALALGIALTTVMYSVLYGTLIRGLPYEHGARIAMINHVDPAEHLDDGNIPYADFLRYAAQQKSFEAFGGFFPGTANVSGGDRPDRVGVARVTSSLFDVAGVRPLLGRTFTPLDNAPASPPAAVIGFSLWRDHFAGDSAVVGKAIRVNGRVYTVVGVMPSGYEFPAELTRIWIPVQTDPAGLTPGGGPPLITVGRLRAGVSFVSADAELRGLSRQLAAELPAAQSRQRASVKPFVRGRVPARVYSLLYAMLVATFLVLLVACANVANLLLNRAANRAREIGIRTALGASRLAIVRQSLVEAGILAALAAILGTALAQAGIVAVNSALPSTERAFWMDIRLHPAVLVFVLLVATVASIAAGLLPAIQSARLDINTILKDESHAASSLRVGRLSRAIVVVEIALSSMMLLASGFVSKSIVNLNKVDPGFTSAGVYTARVSVSSSDTIRQRQFFESLDRELTALPGMNGVYLGSGFPGTGWGGTSVSLEGHVYPRFRDHPGARSLAVTPGFFSTFDVRMARGRPILSSDQLGTPGVAVVNETFARRFYGGADPIGKRIRLREGEREGEWLTIVGVMPTLYAVSMDNSRPPEVITAFWQQGRVASASIALRGADGVAGAASLRKVVAALDPEVPVYATSTIDEVLSQPTWPVRVFGSMFVVFGVVSLLLAAIGLYAVVAFSVSRRVREMGIRMALGATGGDVVALICRQGARQVVLGMSIGFIAGAVLVRAVRMVLFEVQPSDPAVFGLVAAVLGIAAFAACIVPALGATRVDPVIALRAE